MVLTEAPFYLKITDLLLHLSRLTGPGKGPNPVSDYNLLKNKSLVIMRVTVCQYFRAQMPFYQPVEVCEHG